MNFLESRQGIARNSNVKDLEKPMAAAEDAVIRSEQALAEAVLAMAEAMCKSSPAPFNRLQAVRIFYDAAIENLNNVKAETRRNFGPNSQGSNKAQKKPF